MSNLVTPAVVAVGVGIWIAISTVSVLYCVWFQPWRRRRLYEAQGIRGPPFRPILGNHKERMAALKEMTPPNPVPLTQLTAQTVLPDLYAFSRLYGSVNVHEVLWTTILTVAEPALVKEVLVSKADYYQKAPIIRTLVLSVLGRGLVFAEGKFWKQQRRIYTPAFHTTFLKGLFHHIRECCDEVACRWRDKIGQGAHAEVDASLDMSTVTLDIIARSAFGASIPGSAPTSRGVLAFNCIGPLFTGNLRKLFTIAPLIPGYRFLPTADNRKNWERERFINGILEEIIEARLKATATAQHASNKSVVNGMSQEHPYGNDLLGFMVSAWKGGSKTMSRKQILSECKTTFVAGHSTTALGMTWALFLLAVHPEWQERLREEISRVGGGGELRVDDFGKLREMDMFLKEVYRLYPPVTIVYRQCQRSHRIGELVVGAGTVVALPIALMHQSKEEWGQDADMFRPERWLDKGGGVRNPMAFCTFGAGPRNCLGREFAVMETLAMLTTLLPQFELSLAPSYRHAPGQIQSIRPVYGMPLQVKLRR